jgi:hypothetical protein
MLDISCTIGMIFGKSAFVSTVLFDNNINYPHWLLDGTRVPEMHRNTIFVQQNQDNFS